MTEFDINRFKKPDSSRRGLPFWAWNTDVTAEKVKKQIRVFRLMGFGGFIIHARKGLRTEYMGEHFMDMVRLSVECAKKQGLRVWLYDEDGWPSGYAGGAVTVERKYRQKTLLFTKKELVALPREEAIERGEPYLLARYDIELCDGYLKGAKMRGDGEIFAYVMTAPDNPRFNWQAYIDTMNRAAVDRFIELTHERYLAELGGFEGVEAIFTDEPQIARVEPLAVSEIGEDFAVSIPWSDDLPQTYLESYGEDILPLLPRIIFEPADGKNATRYRFNAHIAHRFREAFARPIGEWCRSHGIKFTGHYLYEQSLEVQNLSLRDVMRNYADMDIPGIDVLLGGYEFTTALQCRSVAHQFGRTQMMSELYGVTNYTADFRDYIAQGNWQAALGVTERVPHLTWMSMKGEGKRDYPANFGYQAPWWREFSAVEDHFARLNEFLHAGRPVVRLGVIHPMESHWLIYGPEDKVGSLRRARDGEFHQTCEWLIFGGVDFDYVNEALLPEQFDGERAVGEMVYDAILVPDCLTLRSSTLEILKKMQKSGTRVVFSGDLPALVDGQPDLSAARFAEGCEQIPHTREAILSAFDRLYDFKLTENGEPSERYIGCEREIGGDRWFFLTPAAEFDKSNLKSRTVELTLNGEYKPEVYDTFTGKKRVPEFEQKDRKTHIRVALFEYDSLLVRLKEGKTRGKRSADLLVCGEDVILKRKYSGQNGNVILLDMAEYSLDGVNFEVEEEILRADAACRRLLGLPSIAGKVSPQPWTVKDETLHTVYLRFYFESDHTNQSLTTVSYEDALSMRLNGTPVDMYCLDAGYDDDFKITALPNFCIREGQNVLEVAVNISKTVGLEPMYLYGDFDLALEGTKKRIVRRGTLRTSPDSAGDLAIGSAKELGMPFYGRELIYDFEFDCDGGDYILTVPEYVGALLAIRLDKKTVGRIILPPNSLMLEGVEPGHHVLRICCYGNSHNTFGSLHCAVDDPYCGPMHWRKSGEDFTYEYRLCDMGLTSKPILQKLK